MPSSGDLFRLAAAALRYQVCGRGHCQVAERRLILLEVATLEVPQQRGVDFFDAAKRRADPLAAGRESVHYFLAVAVGERSNRFALQEGESSRWGGCLASLLVEIPSISLPEPDPL